jgi:hypothetical protein
LRPDRMEVRGQDVLGTEVLALLEIADSCGGRDR